MVVAEAAMVTAGGVVALMMTDSALLVAVAGTAQEEEDVSTQLTRSLLLSVVDMNVLLFVPAGTLFTIHCQEGLVPPFVAEAVNIRDPPLQAVVPPGAAIAIVGCTEPFTDNVAAVVIAVSWLFQVLQRN
jgi:hypothetical protein